MAVHRSPASNRRPARPTVALRGRIWTGLLICYAAWQLAAPTEAHAAEADPVARAAALLQAGKLDEAIVRGEADLAASPDSRLAAQVAEAYQRKARLASERGRPAAELLTIVDRGLRVARTARLLKFRGRILAALGGRDAEAYEAYEESLDKGAEGKDMGDAVSEMAPVHQRIAPRMCRVTITTRPELSGVRIDTAAEARPTPSKVWLSRGKHVLHIGTDPNTQTRIVDCADVPVMVHVELAATPAVVPPPHRPQGETADPAGLPTVHAASTRGTADRTMAWTVAVAGAAVALSGLTLYLVTLDDIDGYEQDLRTDSEGLVSGVPYDQAQARQATINTRIGSAAALGAVGIVASGIGTWLLLRSPVQVAVLAAPSGVWVTARF